MTTMFEDDDKFDPDPDRLEFVDKCFENIDDLLDDDSDLPEIVDEVPDFRGPNWGDDVIDAEWEYVEEEDDSTTE